MAGNFQDDWAVDSLRDFLANCTPDTFFEGLVALYKNATPDGADHYPVVYEKIMRLWREEPRISTEDLATITAPTLVVSGDRDVITLEHTIALFRAVPNAQLSIIPGSTHMFISEKPGVVDDIILRFVRDH